MDAKEAIKSIEYFRERISYCDNWYYRKAIEALKKVETLEAENARLREKATPVKIRTETEGIYEPYDDVPIGRKVNLYCGKCGKPLNAYHDYCYWCGQAIKNDKE